VFETLAQAQQFARGLCSYPENPVILFVEYVVSTGACLWHIRYDRRKTMSLLSCPCGTNFADEVTPLCIINEHDPDEMHLKNLKGQQSCR
jgi:hypothetical protein